MEQPVRGLMSLFQQKDIPVLIAINEKGIYVIDHVECVSKGCLWRIVVSHSTRAHSKTIFKQHLVAIIKQLFFFSLFWRSPDFAAWTEIWRFIMGFWQATKCQWWSWMLALFIYTGSYVWWAINKKSVNKIEAFTGLSQAWLSIFLTHLFSDSCN